MTQIGMKKDSTIQIGTAIIDSADNFSNEVKNFLNVIENINKVWEGEDALKYINVLKERYITDLDELTKIIKEYGNHLINAPKAYALLDESFASKDINV